MPLDLLETSACPNCRGALWPPDNHCSWCGTEPPFLAIEGVLEPGQQTPRLVCFAGATHSLRLTNRTNRALDVAASTTLAAGLPGRISLAPAEEAEVRLDLSRVQPPASGILAFAAAGRTREIALEVRTPPKVSVTIDEQELTEGETVYVDQHLTQLPLVVRVDSPVRVIAVTVEGEGFSVPPLTAPIDVTPSEPATIRVTVGSATPVGANTRFAVVLTVEGVGQLRFACDVFRHLPVELEVSLQEAPIRGSAMVKGSTRQGRVAWEVRNLRGEGRSAAEIEGVDFLEPWLVRAPNMDVESRTLEENTRMTIAAVVLPERLPASTTLCVGQARIRYRDQRSRRQRHVLASVTVEIRAGERLQGWLCVDFGTSATCAAYTDPATQGVAAAEVDGVTEIATLLLIRDVDATAGPTIEIIPESGAVAVRSPYSCAMNFKASLDSNAEQMFVDSRHNKPLLLTPSDLVRYYLADLFRRFTEYTGRRPVRVMLTYPAVFGKREKARLLEAAAKALGDDPGREVELGPSEPEALLISYIWKTFIEGGEVVPLQGLTLAVIDVGGGTTDTAIGRIFKEQGGPYRVVVLAAGGDARVGGEWQTFDLTTGTRELNSAALTDYPLPVALGEVMSASGARGLIARNNFLEIKPIIVSVKHDDPGPDAKGQLATLIEKKQVEDERQVSLTPLQDATTPIVVPLKPLLTLDVFESRVLSGLEDAVRGLARMATGLVVRGDLLSSTRAGSVILVPDVRANRFRLGIVRPEAIQWLTDFEMTANAQVDIDNAVMESYQKEAIPDPRVDLVIGVELDRIPQAALERLRTSGASFKAPFDRLILCGNASRLGVTAGRLYLQDMVKKIFGEDLAVTRHPSPKFGVAMGAWFFANVGDGVEIEGLGRTVWDVGVIGREGVFEALFPAGAIPGEAAPVTFQRRITYADRLTVYENHDRSKARPALTDPALLECGHIPMTGRRGQILEITLSLDRAGDWFYSLRPAGSSNPEDVSGPHPLVVSS